MIIKNEKFKRSIISALADSETVAILNAAMFKSMSMNDIIKETNIPRTTAYRKIKSSVESGLMIVVKIIITNEGKKYSLFRSTLRSVELKYIDGVITVTATKNVDPTEKTMERFFSLD